MNFEWRKGPDFAEFAEALKINTSQIAAASAIDTDHILVLYTPDERGRPPIWQASLIRDIDGVLVVKGEPTLSAMSRMDNE